MNRRKNRKLLWKVPVRGKGSDDNVGNTVTLTGTLNREALPTSWLTLTNNGDGTTLLSGTPTNDDVVFIRLLSQQLMVRQL